MRFDTPLGDAEGFQTRSRRRTRSVLRPRGACDSSILPDKPNKFCVQVIRRNPNWGRRSGGGKAPESVRRYNQWIFTEDNRPFAACTGQELPGAVTTSQRKDRWLSARQGYIRSKKRELHKTTVQILKTAPIFIGCLSISVSYGVFTSPGNEPPRSLFVR
jgi:hypothetical protein